MPVRYSREPIIENAPRAATPMMNRGVPTLEELRR
jgi:hypothetical protein